MAANVLRFRREGYLISVEGVRARGGAPGLRLRFGDMENGRVVPFRLSNGIAVNPAPALTLFRAQQGNTEENDRINKEILARLGYTGDHKSAPTVGQFKCGATRTDPVAVEIMWEPGEYGNDVKSVRGRDEDEDGSAFFTGAPAKNHVPDPWPNGNGGEGSKGSPHTEGNGDEDGPRY